MATWRPELGVGVGRGHNGAFSFPGRDRVCVSGCYCSPCKKAGPGLLLKHLRALGLRILEGGDSRTAHCGGLLLTWGHCAIQGPCGNVWGHLGLL